jgi:UPF0755 protein
MKLFRFLLLSTLLVAAALAGAAAWWLNRPLELTSETMEVSIAAGTAPRDIAQAWVDAGVQTSPTLLYQWFRLSGDSRKIRAGTYRIDRSTTPIALLDAMIRGTSVTASVRLLEGWTFRQFRAELAKAEALKSATAAMSDEQIMEALGAAGTMPEGRFYPDTYSYEKGSTDLDVLKRAYQAMQSRMTEAWAERASDTPLRNPDDMLTLASIIEKETGVAADRGLISGVFINRLRLGMLLQTDPTVIYGLGASFDGNLRKRDLQTDTPYNTYTRAGLPPTPIAMPGRASLMAAARPQDTKALYFVARGDGSSVFSETLAEHNRAVNRFQRGN